MNTKLKTLKSISWSSFDNIGVFFLRTIFTIYLARLLSPSDYGLLALLTVFINISEILIQGGFFQALIRKIDVTDEDYSTVFLFNLLTALLLYGGFYFFSPLIAKYFNEPELEMIARVIMLILVFHSLKIVQNVALRRELNFKAISLINIFSTFVSGCVAIYMAYNGFGVWSLVAKTTLSALFTSILFWIFGNWKPVMKISYASLKNNIMFGYKIMIASIITAISGNILYVVVGKIFSADSLGLFYQANKFSSIIPQIIGKSFNDVSYPLLSSMQSNQVILVSTYVKMLRVVSFISIPLMTFLIVAAKPIIIIGLTDKWIGAVGMFQILCFSGMFFPLIVLSGHIGLVLNRSDLWLKYTIVYNIPIVVIIVVASKVGLIAMVVGMATLTLIQLIVNLIIASRLLEVSLYRQVKTFLDISIVSFIIGFISHMSKYIFINNWYLLLSQAIIYTMLFILYLYIYKPPEIKDWLCPKMSVKV